MRYKHPQSPGQRLWTAGLLLAGLLAVCLLAACQRQPDPATSTPLPPPPTTGSSATPMPPAVVVTTLPDQPVYTPVVAEAATTTAEGNPAATLPPPAYPAPSQPPPAQPYPAGTPTPAALSLLPIIRGGAGLPEPTGTPPPTPTPTIDFRAVRAELQANGEDLGFVKIGFHVGPGGNTNGLGNWLRRLDAAGVPFFLKSVDNAGPLYEAQQIMAASGIPHTLVYRTSGPDYDVPDYSLPPEQAAQQHWAKHIAVFPAELDRNLVWLETINEVDANRSEWLARFSLATARLALADGYRWAAFGWASGEPEPQDWQSPAMLEFLRLVAANPDRLAIALHEYSYLADNIGHEYPHKIGRFQDLFQICDQYGIPRPTVLITEWGWAYQNVPPVDAALADIAWASRLYAPYPQVRGAAIWYLGPGFGDIADQAQQLIAPLTEYALGNYFRIPLPPAQAPITPAQYAP